MHRYVGYSDRVSGKQSVYLEFTEPAPADSRLIIGDCLHNLRPRQSRLRTRSRPHLHRPLPEDRGRLLTFPVFGDRATNERGCRNKIGRIHPDAQAVIKGRNRTSVLRASGRSRCCWLGSSSSPPGRRRGACGGAARVSRRRIGHRGGGAGDPRAVARAPGRAWDRPVPRPLGGMVVGNFMNAASLTMGRIRDDVAGQRPKVEAALALEATAGRPSRLSSEPRCSTP